MPEDTKEQRKAYVAGLLREREGHVRRSGGDDDDEKQALIAGIDAELERMGHAAKAPAKRAETRPAQDQPAEKRA